MSGAPVLVAAGNGTTCMVISRHNVHDQDAHPSRATAREHLVAAWQVYPADAPGIDLRVEPIFVSHVIMPGDLVLLPLPGGAWWVPIEGGCRAAGADLSDLILAVEARHGERAA